MADPLSIAASIVGLIAGVAKVVGVLTKVKTSIADAPKSMLYLLSQIKDFEICLSAFDRLLNTISSEPKRRTSMIQVDELIAILTEAVLTFSELEALIIPLGSPSDISILQRVTWAWKEEIVSSLMLRIDRHRSSLSLMLNIVMW